MQKRIGFAISALTIAAIFMASYLATGVKKTSPPADTQPAATAPATQPTSKPATQPVDTLPPWPKFANLPFNVGLQYQQWNSFKGLADAQTFWVTPFVWALQSDNGGDLVQPVMMRTWVGTNCLVGRYYSACTVWVGQPQPFVPQPSAPAEMFVATEMSLGAWSQQAPARQYVDLRQPAVRRKLIAHYVSNCIAAGYKALSIDNVTLGYDLEAWIGTGYAIVVPRKDWTSACLSFCGELSKAAHDAGLRVVVNASMNGVPEYLAAVCGTGIDGVLNEMPMHPNTTGNPDWAQQELDAYAAVLKSGKFIGLVPSCKTGEDLTACEMKSVAAALLVRNPGDKIGVVEMTYKPEPRDWTSYVERLGKPIGPFTRTGNQFDRVFVGGSVHVGMAATPTIAVEFNK